MRRMIAATALFLSASPAMADITATYVNARGYETNVEVNDAGWARIGQSRREEGEGAPDYSVFLPNGDYAVLFDHDDMAGYQVVRWDVFKRAIENSVAEDLSEFKPLTEAE